MKHALRRWPVLLVALTVLAISAGAEEGRPLPGTEALVEKTDFAMKMVDGIDQYLMQATADSEQHRHRLWKPDFPSRERYEKTIEPNRRRFRKITGVVDEREPARLNFIADVPRGERADGRVAEGTEYAVYAVRWSVLKGVEAEGLLLEPAAEACADVVALPDCDWTPEMIVGLTPGVPEEAQFARRLAENGCRVIVPVLIDRSDTYSGIPGIRMTNQPHREFIYRAAFEMGHHIIGYEVQKVLAAVDWFADRNTDNGKRPIGVIGYGEGGLIALYAAAADTRIDAAAVLGYFGPRDGLWREPIYRNVFGLLDEFGDAEIASLIAPRPLIVEASRHPEIAGPPIPRQGRSGAAPGSIETPAPDRVASEVERATRLVARLSDRPSIQLIRTPEGRGLPGTTATLRAFLNALGTNADFAPPGDPPRPVGRPVDAASRHKQQFDQLLEHTQYLMREGEFQRAEFWNKADASNVESWKKSCEWHRDYLWDEVIGRLPPPLPPAPRTRLVYDEPAYRGYEVELDLYPDVIAYGILLVPKDIKDGERRPVVVCQHGLEGRPQDVADPKTDHRAYHRYACRLAERGFITYAPQNPYIGGDRFRVLQRKANPLKLSLFSFIVRQHEQTLEWLAALPFVDPDRIGLYGLSYGGKTAMRVPALLERYCLSICSADYNEWIWKNVSARSPYSYLLTGEYEMPEFDLGNTFNYAELSWLICPRPFMVERGHHDGVAPDDWVAYEFAKTRRRYDLLGIGDRTEIEFFDGPHTIHGVGTFEFLHRHLDWPEK